MGNQPSSSVTTTSSIIIMDEEEKEEVEEIPSSIIGGSTVVEKNHLQQAQEEQHASDDEEEEEGRPPEAALLSRLSSSEISSSSASSSSEEESTTTTFMSSSERQQQQVVVEESDDQITTTPSTLQQKQQRLLKKMQMNPYLDNSNEEKEGSKENTFGCYEFSLFHETSSPIIYDPINDINISATTTTTTNSVSTTGTTNSPPAVENHQHTRKYLNLSSFSSFCTIKSTESESLVVNNNEEEEEEERSNQQQRRIGDTDDTDTDTTTTRPFNRSSSTTTEDHSSSSSLLSNFVSGCVPAPSIMLSRSKSLSSFTRTNNSSSWSNLVQLETLMKNVSEFDYTQDEMLLPQTPTPESDLRGIVKYWIVTTAALPWMTGTAVNPLLRAAYLSQRNRRLIIAAAAASGATGGGDDDSSDFVPPTKNTVTLAVPWLESSDDRVNLYGQEWKDATPNDQEIYIRKWLCESAQLPLEADKSKGGIVIQWYPAKYHDGLSSIFALGDLCELCCVDNDNDHDEEKKASEDEDDEEEEKVDVVSSRSVEINTVCILEEPEHVNFYRAPTGRRKSWRDKFSHVIGIIHTNYKAYAQNHYSGILTGPLVAAISSLMVRAYCDKVVKLSPVLQEYAPEKEIVSNVHGIRNEFLTAPRPNVEGGETKIYYIGKLLWAKGLDKLMDLQAVYRKATGDYWPMDIYGSGPEQKEIQCAYLGMAYYQSSSSLSSSSSTTTTTQQQQQDESTTTTTTTSPSSSSSSSSSSSPSTTTTTLQTASRYWRRFRQPIPANFLGRVDHAKVGSEYKIFINPSITEVLCTTTAEAIAMGKWVIIPKHPSNEFFIPFPNCLQYSTKREFVDLLQHAMAYPPPDTTVTMDYNQSGSNEEGVVVDDENDDTLYNIEEHHQQPPSQHQHHILSWEAATERLVHAGCLSEKDAHRCRRLNKRDQSIQEWHYTLGNGVKGDVIRKVLGGGPVAEQSQYNQTTTTSSSSSSNSTTSTTATTTTTIESSPYTPTVATTG